MATKLPMKLSENQPQRRYTARDKFTPKNLVAESREQRAESKNARRTYESKTPEEEVEEGDNGVFDEQTAARGVKVLKGGTVQESTSTGGHGEVLSTWSLS